MEAAGQRRRTPPLPANYVSLRQLQQQQLQRNPRQGQITTTYQLHREEEVRPREHQLEEAKIELQREQEAARTILIHQPRQEEAKVELQKEQEAAEASVAEQPRHQKRKKKKKKRYKPELREAGINADAPVVASADPDPKATTEAEPTVGPPLARSDRHRRSPRISGRGRAEAAPVCGAETLASGSDAAPRGRRRQGSKWERKVEDRAAAAVVEAKAGDRRKGVEADEATAGERRRGVEAAMVKVKAGEQQRGVKAAAMVEIKAGEQQRGLKAAAMVEIKAGEQQRGVKAPAMVEIKAREQQRGVKAAAMVEIKAGEQQRGVKAPAMVEMKAGEQQRGVKAAAMVQIKAGRLGMGVEAPVDGGGKGRGGRRVETDAGGKMEQVGSEEGLESGGRTGEAWRVRGGGGRRLAGGESGHIRDRGVQRLPGRGPWQRGSHRLMDGGQGRRDERGLVWVKKVELV